MSDVNLGSAVDLTQPQYHTELQTCNECGRNFTASVKMVWCPPCHIYAEFMVMWQGYMYQRWGILPY